MKINLIPSKKLALLSAAFCAVMLAFSHNASALAINDEFALGTVNSPFATDVERTTFINHLIGQALNTTDQVLGRNLERSGNDFGALPTAVFDHNGNGTNITIGSGTYSYLFATYATVRGFGFSEVWYIGNLSGDITIPGTIPGGFGLTGWALFRPGGQGVPDGGTTVMLLGAALGALGMARRFLKA